jgi:bisphosphoglycerate-dependent phosphoglycerate mutase
MWRLNNRMLGNLTGFHHDRAQVYYILNWTINTVTSIASTKKLVDVRNRLLPFFYDRLFNNLYLAQNIRLLNNYTVDAFDHQQIPIDVPIVFEFSLNTNEFFNGYYLSSSLFPNNTHDQHQLFPTGFDNESKSFQKKTNLHIVVSFFKSNL